MSNRTKKRATKVAYEVSDSRRRCSVVVMNANNGRDARSKTLTMFRSMLNNDNLKRDDLKSRRVVVNINEAPKNGPINLKDYK